MRAVPLVLLLVPRFSLADAAVPTGETASARPPTVEQVCGKRRAHSLLVREHEVLKQLLARTSPNDPDRAALELRAMLTHAEIALADPRERAAAIAELRGHVYRPEDTRGGDDALFDLGALLLLDGKDTEARQAWMRLIKSYPTSPMLPRAYLAFGDLTLEGPDAELALKFYEKAMSFPGDRCLPYARYKAGLARLRINDPKKALDLFYGVVGQRATVEPTLGAATRRAIVEAYHAAGGDPAKARNFFMTTGTPDEARAMLRELAQRYRHAGNDGAAIAIEKDL